MALFGLEFRPLHSPVWHGLMAFLLLFYSAAWAAVDVPEQKSPPAPTRWVEQATQGQIDVDLPRFEQLPAQLSIDPLTQQELDELRQVLYRWALNTRENFNAQQIAQGQSEIERRAMTPEQFKAFVAKTKAANLSWGCWSFLYKKVNGKKQTLPVGFRVFIPNGSYQAGALKVNGKMRHGYGIFGENTIYSEAAFWLHSQRPLPADLSTLVSSLDWYGNFDYDEKKVARDTFHFRLAAFGEDIPQKEWEKYRKPKRPTGVQIEKMQVPCNLIAATCRAYSFKIDRLKWTDQHYGQPETWNRTEYRVYELVKSPNVSDEFVLEDSCPGSKWGIFQQSGPGISRGFGSTLSGYYERWINGPFLLKRSSSDGNTVADQLKPFVKTP